MEMYPLQLRIIPKRTIKQVGVEAEVGAVVEVEVVALVVVVVEEGVQALAAFEARAIIG
jgi:hypothetical protein